MPTYQYKCRHCEHNFDIVHKMTDDNLTKCPACKHEELYKVIGATAFQLKGLGWSEGKNPHELIDKKNGRTRTRYGDKRIDPDTKQILNEADLH